MRMPAIFVGHGTPMNAIEHNQFTKEWEKIGQKFKPKAIIMISAHWFTQGTLTQDNKNPEKINDMYGFPDELYTMDYPAVGMKVLTKEIVKSLGESVTVDRNRGIDHGAWSVLVHMYPKADIPVVQLSVDRTKTPQEQFEIGKKITHLREHGYMIIASGNVVHNLGRLNPEANKPHPWASSFDDYIEAAIRRNDFDKCINYLEFGEAANLSVPSPDHYYPLLNILGAVRSDDQVTIFNKGYDMGGLSMTGYLFY